MPIIPSLELTGPQFRPLSQALRARLTLAQFDRMLKEWMDINREDIALGEDYTDIVFKVIGYANRTGQVYKLVSAAREVRSTEPVFVEYARIVGVAPEDLPDKGGLESIIRVTNAQLDITTFLARLGAIEGQVCRIDLDRDGLGKVFDGQGTGFLVGKRTVLTNYHVVEALVKGERGPDAFRCLFDYKVRADGRKVNEGTSYTVERLLTSSHYDSADLGIGGQLPNAKNLDYALLQLDGEPGNDTVGGKSIGEPRGWVAIPQEPHRFTLNSPLFIVQHPAKKPMKLALDTQAVIGLNGNATRVTYRTNTEPGSSGSPCFDQHWRLVALHHHGEGGAVPTHNRGIPIRLIADHLEAGGFGSALGA